MRRIGNSELKVAPLALGGNVFDWTADEAASFAVLDAFADAGGTMIDTADVYSAWVPGHKGGESERLIGRWLKRDPAKRDKIVIATKVGYLDGEIVDGEYVAAMTPDVIARGCEASLERLGIETIDLYYQHRDNESVPLADSLGASRHSAATARSGRSACPILPPSGSIRRWRRQPRGLLRSRRAPALVQSRRAREVRAGRARCGALATSRRVSFLQPRQRVPDRQVPLREPTWRKAFAANGRRNYLQGKGAEVLKALDEVAAESGAALATISLAWTDGAAVDRLRRSPARPASSSCRELTAAMRF